VLAPIPIIRVIHPLDGDESQYVTQGTMVPTCLFVIALVILAVDVGSQDLLFGFDAAKCADMPTVRVALVGVMVLTELRLLLTQPCLDKSDHVGHFFSRAIRTT
jgi:hypothetical protein